VKAQEYLFTISRGNSFFRVPYLANTSIVQHRVYNTTWGDLTVLEWEIIFPQRIFASGFAVEFNYGNLEFYYQPPLNEELNISDFGFVNETHAFGDSNFYRPLNVVGSYAAYMPKQGNNFTTGKLFHLYRPLLIDAENNTCWVSLNITESTLTVSLNQTWLAQAVYPVVLDPSFGYDTVGASTGSAINNPFVCLYTSEPTAGTSDNVTVHCRKSATSGADTIHIAIYNSTPGAILGESGDHTITTSWDWYTVTLSGVTIDASTGYHLGVVGTDGNIDWKYDTGGAANQLKKRNVNNVFPDPWGTSDVTYSFQLSIYCNYSAVGGQTYYAFPSINMTFSLATFQTFYGVYNVLPSIILNFSLASTMQIFRVWTRPHAVNLVFGLATTLNHITASWTVNPSIIVDFALASTVTPFLTYIRNHGVNLVFAIAAVAELITGVYNVNPVINMVFALSSTASYIQHHFYVYPGIIVNFVLGSTTTFIQHLYSVNPAIVLNFVLAATSTFTAAAVYATQGFVLAIVLLSFLILGLGVAVVLAVRRST